MYTKDVDMGELQQANSTPDMLKAEKRMLLMEMQLEEAKAAMEIARHAEREHNSEALADARSQMQYNSG